MNTIAMHTREQLRPLLMVTLGMLLITTVVYPLAVTGVGQLAFNDDANGSIITVDGEAVGSSLIGQVFAGDAYFEGRPSAAGSGYDALSSSGSNLGPTSEKLILGVEDDPTTSDVDESFAGIFERTETYRERNGLADDAVIPADAVTASASGLDPHISLANARLQAARVAAARGVEQEEILILVDDIAEGRIAGFLGEPRVNVLLLNLALDERYPVSR